MSVKVREVSSGKQRVTCEVHTGNDVLSAESDLLYFSKVVNGVSVKSQSSDILNGADILRNELGGVEKIEVELKTRCQRQKPGHLYE